MGRPTGQKNQLLRGNAGRYPSALRGGSHAGNPTLHFFSDQSTRFPQTTRTGQSRARFLGRRIAHHLENDEQIRLELPAYLIASVGYTVGIGFRQRCGLKSLDGPKLA